MAEPPNTGAVPAGSPPPSLSAAEEKEFAAIRRPRTRHPVLALAAAVLALFLVVRMRDDLRFAMSTAAPEDLGDARALLASERGRTGLAGGLDRVVRLHGVPDRESALQVDTKGSWTFTQFFRILGTDSRLFVHRREDPLPAFRAEQDAFEGRLYRFADLSFEDSIRAYFAGHVSSTHYFRQDDIRRIAATGVDAAHPIELGDLAGDKVTLGPNDILAVDLGHPTEVEVLLPAARFKDAEAARAALAARGTTPLRPGGAWPERQSWIVALPADTRDRVLEAAGGTDREAELREVKETIKVRLVDLGVEGGAKDGALVARGGATPRTLPRADVRSIRTLATVQIPPDAYLIIEAETPRDHMPQMAIAAVLLVFAVVNVLLLIRGLRR